jgi:phage terminase small subunit
MDARQALTPQQKIFVEAIKSGVDKTRAAELAGYSHPAVDGCRQLKKPKVQAALNGTTIEKAEKVEKKVKKTSCEELRVCMIRLAEVLSDFLESKL